jgi:hypothetical protein
VTDYAAGIVEHQKGAVAEGKLTLPPEKQRFFVTIRQYTFHGGERCFSKEQMDALKNYKADVLKDPDEIDKESWQQLDDILKGKKNLEAYDANEDAFLCLTTFGAEVGETSGMRSVDGRKIFQLPQIQPLQSIRAMGSVNLLPPRDGKNLLHNASLWKGRLCLSRSVRKDSVRLKAVVKLTGQAEPRGVTAPSSK